MLARRCSPSWRTRWGSPTGSQGPWRRRANWRLPEPGGVALAYEGAPMGLVSTVGREGAGQGAPPAPGRLFSSYRAPRGFGVFGHPCAKVLMGQWLFDTIPSKLDVEGSSPFSRSPCSDLSSTAAASRTLELGLLRC
jgi:hypothetical protein